MAEPPVIMSIPKNSAIVSSQKHLKAGFAQKRPQKQLKISGKIDSNYEVTHKSS